MKFKRMEQELIDEGINPVYIKYINDLEERAEKQMHSITKLCNMISKLELELIDIKDEYKI